MSEINPYASPASPSSPLQQPYTPGDGSTAGLWREGNLLVMHKDAPLPDRCVKTNQPANGVTLKRKLQWHHPAVALAVLISPLVYIILALILMKRATIYIGLTEEWVARRKRAIMIAWLVVLVGALCFAAGILLVGRDSSYAMLFLAGFVIALAGGIYGGIAARLVRPTKITETHIWLKGVHPDFLAGLPEL